MSEIDYPKSQDNELAKVPDEADVDLEEIL